MNHIQHCSDMKGVYVFLADGFEDVEALGTVDVLRRGGVDVRTVSVTGRLTVESSHHVMMVADCLWEDIDASAEGTDGGDVMIFPGGMPGASSLAAHGALVGAMKKHYAAGGAIGAICAAPGLVVSQLPGIAGLRFTCYDGFETAPVAAGGVYVAEGVVTDGRLITGRGPGYALEFGLALLSYLSGPEKAEGVRAGLYLK